MLRSRSAEKICLIFMIAAVIIAAVFMNGEKAGIVRADAHPEYEARLFDDSYVHEIDIHIEEWDSFLENALDEEYAEADITVDGEEFRSVGIRIKGNNSKNLISKYGQER